MTTRIQHLMTALHHLGQVEGFELEMSRLRLAIQEIYEQRTSNLRGQALIERLDDEELAAAIRVREERLDLYSGPHIDPFMFNYIRHHRPQVAAVEFSRSF